MYVIYQNSGPFSQSLDIKPCAFFLLLRHTGGRHNQGRKDRKCIRIIYLWQDRGCQWVALVKQMIYLAFIIQYHTVSDNVCKHLSAWRVLQLRASCCWPLVVSKRVLGRQAYLWRYMYVDHSAQCWKYIPCLAGFGLFLPEFKCQKFKCQMPVHWQRHTCQIDSHTGIYLCHF